MNGDLFAPGYKPLPFWWERSPLTQRPDTPLPEKADVVVIGSGYTGLTAAIQTARGGRHTVVIEAEAIGIGCSTRNGGQASTSLKPSYGMLAEKYGPDLAYDLTKEGHNALKWLGEYIEEEGIDASFRKSGRYYAAHSPGNFDKLIKTIENPPKGLETDGYVVTKAEQPAEIDSALYHGGIVLPKHAAVDPGAYHKGLVDNAEAAGVTLVEHCRAQGIDGQKGNLTVRTSKGTIHAKNVVVATNGYTTKTTAWHQRRVIPIGSYVLATVPLEPALIERLIPNDRVISDTRKLVVYYRTCPERKRILFGGRVSINETDPTAAAPALHAEMVRRFPDLAETPISHCWEGFVAYTFDEMPHLGERDGVHYSMGYCGSGVSLSGYFGTKVGLQVLGRSEGDSPLTGLDFPTRPYYWGKPWFLAPSIRYYRWADERAA